MGNSKTSNQKERNRAVLYCPVRGALNAAALSKDNLTPSEESRRIDLIIFLLERDYPPENLAVETVILKNLGEKGRNKLRCDIIAYKLPANELANLPINERIEQAVLVGEVKRDSAKKQSGVNCQLEPAMRQLPGMNVMGAYWDDINRLLFVKQLIKKNGDEHLEIIQDTLSNLPKFRIAYKIKPIFYSDLDKSANLVGVLWGIANVMRSHNINDEQLRYKETVKLLLARYCDEKEGKEAPDEPLSLQVFPGIDHNFMKRVQACYRKAANRYSRAKTLFYPTKESELKEPALRDIIKNIQGLEFLSASNETMQQVFMSFVPAVFKKSLDQYFTPIGLIQAMVQMVKIGPNDKIADPGMGTADFLTAAMEYRACMGDRDSDKRVFGIDSDQKAFDLAVVNMILNKDGQAGLVCGDSIKNHAMYGGEMEVVLCNPPFGEKSVERRPEILRDYDLGHRWEFNRENSKWEKTDDLMAYQQLGILFIERCFKMMTNRGKLGIILPEGYLCTPMYGYVRQWIVDNLRILSLTELPRRIFLKSQVDLRSNIMIAQKVSRNVLAHLIRNDYAIHAEMVRKVGFKMGKGYQPLYLRDPETGIEIRDKKNNALILDTDFRRVCDTFDKFTQESKWNRSVATTVGSSWDGARIGDILSHKNLDMKPRRLMPRALTNVKAIKANSHKRLEEIADVVQETFDILASGDIGKKWRLVEGQGIRAVEGIVIPGYPSHAWQIAERKARFLYPLKGNDIVVGLVRPERRNIGILIPGSDIVGAPDGISVVRIKPEFEDDYPQEWLFAALRSEACRLQLWTESGGTSYGKLTNDNVLEVLVAIPSRSERCTLAERVKEWFIAVQRTVQSWEMIGSPEDRFPVVNSPSFGLVETTPGMEEQENGDE